MAKNILIRPLITEKSDKGMDKQIYTFIVDKTANKLEVAKAVEAMFNVSVGHVNTAIIPGKVKTRGTKSGTVKGMKPGHKKAYITLQKGEKIDIFGDAVDQA